MKKVVSFSVWGDHPAYCLGAIENAKLIGKNLYKGWESWFYLGNDVPVKYVSKLKQYATKIVFVNRSDFTLAFDRFYSIFDPQVKISVSRDADSRVSDKEYQAVLEWERSDYPMHSMRDHKLHHWPVMAGMWGVKKPAPEIAMGELKRLYESKSAKFKTDQIFLDVYYDRYKELFLKHGTNERFSGKDYPPHLPFDHGSYIGERIDQHGNSASELNGFGGRGY
jgi:hypothetical protein